MLLFVVVVVVVVTAVVAAAVAVVLFHPIHHRPSPITMRYHHNDPAWTGVSQLRSVEVQVAVPGSPSLIIPTVSGDLKQH